MYSSRCLIKGLVLGIIRPSLGTKALEMRELFLIFRLIPLFSTNLSIVSKSTGRRGAVVVLQYEQVVSESHRSTLYYAFFI